MADWAIGTVTLMVLIFGITEFMKEFGVSGIYSRLVVFGVALGFILLASAYQEGMIADEYWKWVKLVVTAIAGALGAMGYYDYMKRRG